MRTLAVTLLALAACHRVSVASSSVPAPPPPRAPVEPTRTAVGDSDLRVMIAEIAAAKACALMRGVYLPLPDAVRHDAFGGDLWLHDCTTAQRGTHVTFALAGDGWQWIDQAAHKAGGTFAVKQYVRFHITATIPGALDLAYAPSAHVMTLWFTPERVPDVTFAPLGTIDVDSQGLWSSVIGGVGSLFGSSPSDKAGDQARDTGVDQFKRQLVTGFSATMDLCSGLTRIALGRPAAGAMAPPQPGESKRVPSLLQPGGLLVQGPYRANHGMTIDADVPTGAVHLAIMCRDQADRIAAAFVAGQPLPRVVMLAEATVHGRGKIVARGVSCPVAVVATPIAGAPAVSFDWMRPPHEAGAAFGGPKVDCK